MTSWPRPWAARRAPGTLQASVGLSRRERQAHERVGDGTTSPRQVRRFSTWAAWTMPRHRGVRQADRESAGRGGPPSRRALLVAGGLVVVGGGVAVVASRRSATPPTPSPSPSALGSPSVTARRSPMVVTDLGRPLLGVSAGWDLFALADDALVRVQLASGRITRSPLPALGSGPVSLVPARGRLLIHPPDSRPGYVVPDDRPVTDMPPPLNGDGPLLPGPDADHVWVETLPGQMSLVTLAGKPAGLDITVPPYVGPGIADGSGYVLFQGVGGVYRGGRGGLRRVTTGQLMGVGPTGMVTVDCDDRARCGIVLRSRGGRTSVVPALLEPQGPNPGAISPDGTSVAVYAFGQAGDVSVTLVELDNGASHPIDLPLTATGAEGTIVWSPDGRWLFAVNASQQLKVINARTFAVTDLVPGLPSIRQLVVRP